MLRHFPAPPRIYMTFAGKPHRLNYMTRADASALVAILSDLFGEEIPEDTDKVYEAISTNRYCLTQMLIEAFPDGDSIPSESDEVRSRLFAVVWTANDIPDILDDLIFKPQEASDDSLAWPKLCLQMRARFGVDEATLFERWTYWQFCAFMKAIAALADEEEIGKAPVSGGASVEELVKQGITGI